MKVIGEVAPVVLSRSERWGHVLRFTLGITAIVMSAELALKILWESLNLQEFLPTMARRTWYFVACMVLLYVSANLFSSRKYPVLYLRRFGMPENAKVRRAVKGGLGRTFRLIALADSRFAQVGIPLSERIVGIAGIPLALTLAVVGSYWLFQRFLS